MTAPRETVGSSYSVSKQGLDRTAFEDVSCLVWKMKRRNEKVAFII